MTIGAKRSNLFCRALVLAILFSCGSSSAEKTAAPKIEFPEEAVTRQILDNGLTILVKESPSRGLVSIDARILAGSSLEKEYSGSGISHFVEHMVFKGTKIRKPGEIESEVKSYGGLINGSASLDEASFRLTVPAACLEKALALLKDMLMNASFEPAEFEKEKNVILNEIKLNNDDPESVLTRRLYQTAYLRHPYRHPPIGYEGLFKALKREDLVKYYERMYRPNRIVIGIAGGISPKKAIDVARKEFNDFRPPDYEGIALEPEARQISRRELGIDMSTNMSYLALGFHSTSLLDKDIFSMDVLAMILGRGDNSRLVDVLYKKKGLVYSISCWNYTPRYPGLFVIRAILDKDNLSLAQGEILSEIRKIKNGSLGDAELESARRMVLADYIFSRETQTDTASDIAQSELLAGDYGYSRKYVDGIQSVTKEDIKRACETYLSEANMSAVRIIPGARQVPEPESIGADIKEMSVYAETLQNGLRVIIRENPRIPAASITVSCLGGLSVEDEHSNGISSLFSRMLLKGTQTRKEYAIRGAIEAQGGSITSASGMNSFGISMSLLKDNIDLGLDILKDILMNSIFPQDELDREKILTLAMIKEEDDDMFQRGVNALRKDLYGQGRYGLRFLGEASSITALTREDFISFHKRYCVPKNMVICVSGDINTFSLTKRLAELFKDMPGRDPPPMPGAVSASGGVKAQTIEMEREESLVLWGFRTASIKDPDRHTLDVLSSILSGYSGRFFASLRNNLSLAYALGANQRFGMDTGYMALYVATTSDKINEAKKALSAEIKAIQNGIIGEEEIASAKRELSTQHDMGMDTNDFFSSQGALAELYGLGYGDLFKYKSGIERVTKKDLRDAAQKYLDLGAYAEVVVKAR